MRTPKQPTHGILYRGPSVLDGAPIVVVATYRETATNRKTGTMLQTWILRADMNPSDAIRTGADVSVCGDCAHRGTAGFADRSCYVNIGQAPQSVFRAFTRGAYADVDPAVIGAGRMVRLGAYGDPAAVPVAVWDALLSRAVGHTGYTHQWRRAPALRTLCMASVDTADERADAVAAGWRTFRVRTADEARDAAEFACPAAAESGAKVQCAECRSCAGADGRRGSPVIVAHGAFARRFAPNQRRVITLHRVA